MKEDSSGALELYDGDSLDQEEDDLDDSTEDLIPGQEFAHLEGINLADGYLSEEELEELKDTVLQTIEADLESSREHFENLKKGVNLLGIKLEDSGDLGDWSCGATHPLIAENGIKFQAMAINELDPPDNLVKTKIEGKTSDEDLENKALRKQGAINHYLTTVIDDEFYLESARCHLNTSYFGTGFKYIYFDDSTGKICDEFLKVDQLITNFSTKALSKANSYTILRPASDIDIINGMNSGKYRQIDLDERGHDGDNSRPAEGNLGNTLEVTSKLEEVLGFNPNSERLLAYTFTMLDAKEFDEDIQEGGAALEGLSEEEKALFEDETDREIEDEDDEKEAYYDKKFLPFIVITELYSGEVLGVYSNWEFDQKSEVYKPKEYVVDYHFIPGFGFYSLGYIHVLGNFAKMLTSIMRSLVDAGTFANMPGGFRLKGSKMGGTQELIPGNFIEIESTAQDITKTIMALPFKEPSAVLNAMYSQLENRGQMFANATEGVVSGATNYGPVGTTMALIEASSKLSTAIIRGFHRSRRREYAIISRLMGENFEEYPYDVDGVDRRAFKEDFEPNIAIYPCSDPNVPSQAQRLALAQQKLTMAQQFPQVHNLREALKAVYRAMGETNVDKLLPPTPEAKPLSPMEDIMAASQGMPIKAFPGQNHQAHIGFKQAFIQNPQFQQNEHLQTVIQALVSNIREHTLVDFQEKIGAATTGAATDPQTQARVQAQVAQQLTQQAQVAAKAAQNAQDPAFMIAQAQVDKVKIDGLKVDSTEKREYATLALKNKELNLKEKELTVKAQLEDNKLKADLVKEQTKIKAAREDRALDLLSKAAHEDITFENKARLDMVKLKVDQNEKRASRKAKVSPKA